MGQILGKILDDDGGGPRGPDLMHRIEVPEAWFHEGAGIEIELPRRLACARCEGGGCDACGRAGALSLRGADDAPELVQLTLPEKPESGAVVLKIPDAGGYLQGTSPPGSGEAEGDAAPPAGEAAPGAAQDGAEGSGRGMLFLRVRAGEAPSPGVRRTYGVQSVAALSQEERRKLVRYSALLVTGLVLLFLAMLWLSGWL